MKRMALILGTVLALSGSAGNARAHGCYGFWPFWPLALGATIAIASAASAHSSPTYVYAPPAYPYGYPYSYPQPHNSSGPQSAQPSSLDSAPAFSTFEQASHWTPSSPGTGHWVPDPTPYNYAAGVQPKAVASLEASSQVVTVTRSNGNVPIYVVRR